MTREINGAAALPPPARRFILGFLPMPASSRLAEEAMARANPHIAKALEEEKREGQRLAIRARTIALAITAVLLVIINPRLEVIYYQAFLGVFILIGLAQLRAARVGQSGAELALIFADLALLTVILTVPNPLNAEPFPTAMQYRFDGFIYFFIFLAGSTLAYSWRTVQTVGVWTALVWLGGVGLVVWLGSTSAQLGESVRLAVAGQDRIWEILDPNSVEFPVRLQEVVVFLIVAAILAMKSRRTNDLLLRQAAIAAERANLSRYFPPTMVEELARRSQPMGGNRSQDVAVLFADIVGFTRMAQDATPGEIIGLLREFHSALEDAVFANGGTLDKYMGDGIMASFGTPSTSPQDAENALSAAFAMQDAVARLNAVRRSNGLGEIRLSVGLHFGPVVLGDIGSERRMEFAMLGDTVNVAARLENATRQIGCRIAASDAVLAAVADPQANARYRSLLSPCPGLRLRGRDEAIDAWTA